MKVAFESKDRTWLGGGAVGAILAVLLTLAIQGCPAPTPPVPPDPPVPTDGLTVAIVAPEPRTARSLTPDQIAIPTSRTVRDFVEKYCARDADGKTPKYRLLFRSNDTGSLPSPWKEILDAAPKDGCSLTVVAPKKSYSGPLPADVPGMMKILEEAAGTTAAGPASQLPSPREIPASKWDEYNPPDRAPIVNGEKRFLSLTPRNLAERPRGKPLSAYGIHLIPRDEWPNRIAALKKASAGLMALTYQIPPYDQDGTNYCWANAPCQGWTAMAYQQGRPLYRISAASVGGPITGYRNVGGYGLDAVQFLAEKGGVNEALWPSNDISSAYDKKAEVRADRPRNKLTAMLADLGASGKMFDEVATCVLLGAPCPVGYNWWSHEVLAVGLDQKGGKYYLVLRNSWGDYEDHGFFLLPEGKGKNKGTPDDAQAILSVLPDVISSGSIAEVTPQTEPSWEPIGPSVPVAGTDQTAVLHRWGADGPWMHAVSDRTGLRGWWLYDCPEGRWVSSRPDPAPGPPSGCPGGTCGMRR